MDFAFQGRHTPQKLTAMVASHQPPHSSQSWYSDTGATHHVTSDLDNLSIHTSYHGSDSIQVGNGAALSISNTGTTTLNTPWSKFSLIMFPQAYTNLLSVPQFSRDNHCYFCFDDNGFCVRTKLRKRCFSKAQLNIDFTPFVLLLRQYSQITASSHHFSVTTSPQTSGTIV